MADDSNNDDDDDADDNNAEEDEEEDDDEEEEVTDCWFVSAVWAASIVSQKISSFAASNFVFISSNFILPYFFQRGSFVLLREMFGFGCIVDHWLASWHE